MHLYIRADANYKIGTGHIMRCVALAQTWQDQGGEVTFISRCDSEPLKQRIKNEGFGLIPIDRICPDPSDLKITLSTLKNDITDQKKWLVLDGYHFTPNYQKTIRDAGMHLLVIDDMNHLPHYHADILLNQNIHAPDLTYNFDEDTTLLMGSQYVLLRREFLKYRNFDRHIPDRAKNILVTLGGADPDNVTLKVIEALKLLNERDIIARIIIGPANPHQEILRKSLTSTPFETELLTNPSNMPELMAWADIAVSAGGSTCWELTFMGLPALCIVLANNQREAVRFMVEGGYITCLQEAKKLNPYEISNNVNSLVINSKLRSNLSRRGNSLISGNGSFLILNSLIG